MSVVHIKERRHETPPVLRSVDREKHAVGRKSGNGIGSLHALHADALAIAQEAIARYREFAAHVADHGNDAVADLFSRLAELEAEHAFHLAEVAAGTEWPKPAPGEYSWLHSGAPLPEARDFIFRMLTPRQALEIAVRAEERARAVFEQLFTVSNDAGVRELAIGLARDEEAHIAWLRDALARVPEPFRPSDDCAGDPATLQAL